jgi:hypothetical protein
MPMHCAAKSLQAWGPDSAATAASSSPSRCVASLACALLLRNARNFSLRLFVVWA